MSQITTCPSCGTRFRVVADQLRISDGWVRCGQCQAVFDARDHMDMDKSAGAEGKAPSPASGAVASGMSPRPYGPWTSATPTPRAADAPAESAAGQWSHQQDAVREQERARAASSESAVPVAVPSKGYELPAPQWADDIDFSSYQPESSAMTDGGDEKLSSALDGEQQAHVQPEAPGEPPAAHRSADLQAARMAVSQAQDAAAAKGQGDEAAVRTEPLWDTVLPAAPKREFPSLDLSVLQVSVAEPPAGVVQPTPAAPSGEHKPLAGTAAPVLTAAASPAPSVLEEGREIARENALSSAPSTQEVLSKEKRIGAATAVPVAAPVPPTPASAWPDLDPVWSAAPAAPRVGQEVDVPQAAAIGTNAAALESALAVEIAAPLPPSSPILEPRAEPVSEPVLEPQPASPVASHIDALEAAAQRLAQTQGAQEPTAPQLSGVADGAWGHADEDLEPGFVRDARRKAWWQKPVVRVAMGAAVVVLPVALMLQVALHERNALVAWQPSTRPALDFLCTALQCHLAPRQHIASMVVTGSSFTQHGGDRAYLLHLSVQNKASTALGMPALELTLTDAQDQAIARKVISAKELGAPVELAAGREWSGTVPVSTDGLNLQVAGFRLMLFYP